MMSSKSNYELSLINRYSDYNFIFKSINIYYFFPINRNMISHEGNGKNPIIPLDNAMARHI